MDYRLAAQPAVLAHRWHRVAFVHRGRKVSFDALDQRASSFATGAFEAGLTPGDRVLVLAPNSPEFFEVLIGCARAGLVAVPVNWRLSADEARAIATDSGARALVADSQFDELAAALAEGLDLRLTLLLGGSYETWLGRHLGEARAVDAAVLAADAVVLQVYTSGTSGRPKGVLLTNRNLAAKVPKVTPRWRLTDESTSLLATPLFHVGAISWGLAGLHAGATTVLAGDATPTTVLGHLVDDRVSHTFLVPTMIRRLCESVGPEQTFPDLRAIVHGASPISAEEQREAVRVFGPVLHHVYGLSETTGAVSELAPGPAPPTGSARPGSVGRPYPWIELEIRDAVTGAPHDVGTVGEVWTRSEQNTPGYFGLPEESAALLTEDGWLRTGDGGWLDDDGHLFLTDRVKDMVISGGENVYPAEVEAVLRHHPHVAEVAAFGVPDSRWGEVVAIAVVPRAGCTPALADLVAFTEGRLAAYKRPRSVMLVDELPRNPTGKVLRRHLKEQHG